MCVYILRCFIGLRCPTEESGSRQDDETQRDEYLEPFVPRFTHDDTGDDGREAAAAHQHRTDVGEVVKV